MDSTDGNRPTRAPIPAPRAPRAATSDRQADPPSDRSSDRRAYPTALVTALVTIAREDGLAAAAAASNEQLRAHGLIPTEDTETTLHKSTIMRWARKHGAHPTELTAVAQRVATSRRAAADLTNAQVAERIAESRSRTVQALAAVGELSLREQLRRLREEPEAIPMPVLVAVTSRALADLERLMVAVAGEGAEREVAGLSPDERMREVIRLSSELRRRAAS
jgi:hypothetical protein